jgi:hypothetical protein
MGNQMTQIDEIKLTQIIADQSNNSSIKIENYDISISKNIVFQFPPKSISIINCKISGNRLIFKHLVEEATNNNLGSLNFENCILENEMVITSFKLFSLRLKYVEATNSNFRIYNSEIKSIEISGSKEKDNNFKNIVISNTNVSNSIRIENTTFQDNFQVINCETNVLLMTKINLNKLSLINSKINKKLLFTNSTIESINALSGISISDCIIFNFYMKIIQNQKDFHFRNNNILDNFEFGNYSNNESNIYFTDNHFEKNVYFDSISINEFNFKSVFFKGIVTFQNINSNEIKFKSTHFDKASFYDNFKINFPKKCDLKTIRLIKNQLIKTENRIDLAYYNILENDLVYEDKKTSKQDKVLLFFNKYSNRYNTDWVLGIGFTFITSFIFFIFLLIANTFIENSKYPLCLNLKFKLADFEKTFNYFLKFIFNIGYKDEEISSNGFLFFIFIMAKIFIGYGIYQTIQAFRKYGK